MLNEDIIRAWKDEDYWHSLSEEMRSQLPENPAGIVELSEGEIELIVGGLIVISDGGCTINSNNSDVCITSIGGSPCSISKKTEDGVCINPIEKD